MFTTGNDGFPDGFSMWAGVQHFLFAGRAARVDKTRKEEAAGVGCDLREMSAVDWGRHGPSWPAATWGRIVERCLQSPAVGEATARAVTPTLA